MARSLAVGLALVCLTLSPARLAAEETNVEKVAKQAAAPAALNFTMKSLDGQDVDLAKYRGKVVLFVNVASRCGLTPQYEALESLHRKYADRGLAIVGVPCDQFGGQEPGSPAEIREFCSTKYKVDFDLLAKVDVNGAQACDLYKHLTSRETKPQAAGPISWNFEKFVLSRTGEVVGRFSPKTTPDNADLVQLVEAELAKSAETR